MNTRTAATRGLSSKYLDRLVRWALDPDQEHTHDWPDEWAGAKATPAVKAVAKKFERDLGKAMGEWHQKNPDALAKGIEVDDLLDDGAAQRVLSYLREGWPINRHGDWTRYFVPWQGSEASLIKDLEQHLKKMLGKYATGNRGGGSFNKALSDAVEGFPQEPYGGWGGGNRWAAGTYVQITREEFEDWLDSLGFRGKWRLKPGRGGMYQLFLSPQVMIEINSTTGSQAQVMQRGRASMSLKLVSRVTGRVLNKKAMGQRHFARTTNWRKNWAKGVERMKATYEGSKGWYNQIAEIEDRDKYKAEMMGRIEAIPDWDGDAFLTSLHERLGKGGVLTSKQKSALERTEGRRQPTREPEPPSRPPREQPEPPTRSRVQEPDAPTEPAWQPPDIETVRELYRRARASNDTWTLGFAESVGKRIKAGRPLTERQQQRLDEKLEDYRLGPNSRRAHIAGW